MSGNEMRYWGFSCLALAYGTMVTSAFLENLQTGLVITSFSTVVAGVIGVVVIALAKELD